MLIVNGTEKSELAHAFINFVLEPENHARLAQDLLYACPNKTSIDILAETAPEQLANRQPFTPLKSSSEKGYPPS